MPRKGQRYLGEDRDMLAVRLPRSIVAIIDERVDQMQRDNPDLPINRVHALMNLIRRALAADVTDTVTDTTVTDPAQLRLMLDQELRAVFAHAAEVLDAIRAAEHGTGTGTDAETVTDTVTDTQSQPDQAAAPQPKTARATKGRK